MFLTMENSLHGNTGKAEEFNRKLDIEVIIPEAHPIPDHAVVFFEGGRGECYGCASETVTT